MTLGTQGIGATEPGALPDAAAVARGWPAQLDRGMRVELPDEPLQRAVETARAATVLAGQAWRVEPEVVGGARGLGARRRGGGGVEPASPVGPGASSRRRAPPHRPRGPRCARRAATPDAALLAALRVGARARDRRRASRCSPTGRAEWIGSADRRARRADATRAGVVLGAVARRPSGAALGGARTARVHRARARPHVVDDRGARRGAPRVRVPRAAA